jgi:GTPase SAR1 family protein
MGALFSTLYALLWRTHKNYKLVVVGLDNAGKTTSLYKLQLGARGTFARTLAPSQLRTHTPAALRADARACCGAGEIVCTTPTVGANMEELVFQNVHFEARAPALAHTLRPQR